MSKLSQVIVSQATIPAMAKLFGNTDDAVGISAFLGSIMKVVEDGKFDGGDFPHVVEASQEAFDVLADRIDIPLVSERMEENIIDPIFRKYLIPQVVRLAFYKLDISVGQS